MAGTSEGSKKGWGTRRANKARSDRAFRNRSVGQRKRRERERVERIGGGGSGIPKQRFQRYRVFTLTPDFGEYFSTSFRDIQKSLTLQEAPLYTIFEYMNGLIEMQFNENFELSNIREQWDMNFANPTGNKRTFEFEMYNEDDELVYWLIFGNGEIRESHLWEDFDFIEFRKIIRGIGVWNR